MNGDGANAHSRVKREKLNTATINALRRPITSVTAPIVMPIKPTTEISEALPGFRCQGP
jgi:hypothetical protein